MLIPCCIWFLVDRCGDMGGPDCWGPYWFWLLRMKTTAQKCSTNAGQMRRWHHQQHHHHCHNHHHLHHHYHITITVTIIIIIIIILVAWIIENKALLDNSAQIHFVSIVLLKSCCIKKNMSKKKPMRLTWYRNRNIYPFILNIMLCQYIKERKKKTNRKQFQLLSEAIEFLNHCKYVWLVGDKWEALSVNSFFFFSCALTRTKLVGKGKELRQEKIWNIIWVFASWIATKNWHSEQSWLDTILNGVALYYI